MIDQSESEVNVIVEKVKALTEENLEAFSNKARKLLHNVSNAFHVDFLTLTKLHIIIIVIVITSVITIIILKLLQ